MKSSWRLGAFSGIEIRVHVTFAIFFVGLMIWGMLAGGGAHLGRMLTLVASVFLLALLHEGTHAVVARFFGVRTVEMLLLPFSGMSKTATRISDPMHAFFIAIAGPAVNLLLSGVLFLLLVAGGADFLGLVGTILRDCMFWLGWEVVSPAGPGTGVPLEILEISLIVGAVNLLPVYPLDGGPALRAFLTALMPVDRALRTASRAGAVVSLAIVVLGLLTQNFIIAMLGFFIFMSSRRESTIHSARLMLEGLRVRAAMTTQFIAIASHDTIENAEKILLTSTQQDFPIVGDDGRYLGMLTTGDLLRELPRRGPLTRVIDISERGRPTLSPEDSLVDVFDRLAGLPRSSFPVFDEGKFVGLLNSDGIQKLLMLREAKAGGSRRLSPFRNEPEV